MPKSKPGYLSSGGWLVVVSLMYFSFVDLPIYIRVGSISITTLVTGILTLSYVVWIIARKKMPLRVLSYTCPLKVILIIGITRLALIGPLNKSGVQNIFVMLTLLYSITFAALNMHVNPHTYYKAIKRGMKVIDVITLSIVLLNLVIYGWGSGAVGANWLVGPRSLAVFALLPLSWHLANWSVWGRKSSLSMSIIWVISIFVSLSRTALIASVLLSAVAVIFARKGNLHRLGMALAFFVFVVIGIMVVTSSSNPLRDRFVAGDGALVISNLTLNTSGRITIWKIVWESALESPLIGRGLGTSELVVEENIPGLRHPHNDYLRIFHDLGITGLLLFLAQLGLWTIVTWQNYTKCVEEHSYLQAMSLMSFMAVFAVSIIMLTDNPLAYSFVMSPLGLIVGAGLMSRCKR